ncbi:hypothetical protein AXG93_1163s1110 [Marchantia polymorpha subsp. ruderalis]|uniref:CCHC-type domain-containing protein n=1 Tax=Marchantia polymorpha subsp. ruderalis TaxID=1480154 RepID=A0A176VYV0_MARPO|nr:hypothetical protein AXG93_1163s1110 [Marchantia polymorpha subsp. ruderalis]
MALSKVGGPRFEVERFDGRTYYLLWEWQVKNVIKAMSLGKVLKPKPLNVDDEYWNEIQNQAVSIASLYLKPNVLKQVEELETVTTMFQALQAKYHMKQLSNQLFTSFKLMSFKMVEGTKIQDQIDAFNDLLMDLLNLGANLSDEKKSFQFLSSLPSSYHILSRVLLHRDKKSITYNEVVIALLTDDIQQKLVSSSTPSLSSIAFYVTRGRMEKRSTSVSKSQNRSKSREGNKKEMKCWKCGKLGHMKKDCRSKPHEKKEEYVVERGSTVIMKAHKRKNLYILKGSTIFGEVNSMTSLEYETRLRHARLGHMSEKGMCGSTFFYTSLKSLSLLRFGKPKVETQTGEKVKFLRSDNSGEESSTKLDPKSTKCIFLGYQRDVKVYRL